IRANREKPGLMRQHLTAVEAAAKVGRAKVEGAELRSSSLTFIPGDVEHGDYDFDVGTAGSVTLVFQTILPGLLCRPGKSAFVLKGGTHNPLAPSYDFLEKTFLPILGRMGIHYEIKLDRYGFYPRGGGEIRGSIESPGKLVPHDLIDRGPVQSIRVRAAVADLARHIAEREIKVIKRKFRLSPRDTEILELPPAWGPGNVVWVEIQSACLTEVFTGFGQRGIRAEHVAHTAAKEADEYLSSGVSVGPHLADQLLIPLALAGGGSFLTSALTDHARTNIEVIQRFMKVRFGICETAPNQTLVTVQKSF
ncbi:MAG: RNA 3'-terminal phosphate cyclase, partial [Candidatus Omnitrophica bacterium]|nr:RNA 3'-terminal phosphate cyclase [Candidatus Omnitrophota bacterium]